MKKLFSLPASSIIALLFTFQISTTSCTKTNTVTKIVTDTVTKVQIDTLQEKDTTLTTAILTANSWKVQESRGLVGNNYVYYLRGGSSNTESLDNEYITFNSSNTGTYTDNSGIQTSFTWNFTDATNTKVIWLWNLPTPLTVTWENISYHDGAIRYTEYYTQNAVNVLASETRIPK
jgi:hypothetical protein